MYISFKVFIDYICKQKLVNCKHYYDFFISNDFYNFIATFIPWWYNYSLFNAIIYIIKCFTKIVGLIKMFFY